MPTPLSSVNRLDEFGLPVSAGAAACDAYGRAVRAMLTADVGAEQALDEALACEPDFALAHIARARLLWMRAELPAAREASAVARRCAEGSSRRERQHVAMIAEVVEGRPVQALAAAREHLAEFPRDAMVVAPCTNVFGLFGFSGRPGWEYELRDFLDALAPAWVDDGWFMSLHAFAVGEAGDHDRARRLIGRSLELAPRNAHGAHAYAHLLYEVDDPATTVSFLREWLPGYPADAQFNVHLNWHLALSLLRAGQPDQAWAVYRAQVHPAGRDGPQLNILTDAAAFLWRAELSGHAVSRGDWQTVCDYAAARFPQPGLAFADCHVAMALAALGDHRRLEQLVDALEALLAAGRLPAGAVVPAMARAFGALRAGDARAAVGWLHPLRHDVQRVGGSRAQRDLPAWVLLRACEEAGHRELADALRAEPRLRGLPAMPGAGPVRNEAPATPG
ncbi:MAG TPA: tetratricopeptide repeat protein [Burkholderiaceae bacterium]|nr:tetratricopeptide repeat protein [Burkholderiaceae bacterium]